MKFVKGAWKLLVAVKDAMVLCLLLLFFATIFALLSARPAPTSITEGALTLALDGTIVEEPSPVDPLDAVISNQTDIGEYRLRDVVRAIESAANDDRIKVVVLDLDRFLGGGQVSLMRVAGAIDTVREAGKPVLAYATIYGDDAYLLASHASEIWLNPLGGAVFPGPGGTRLYYKGLFDRFGVNAHVFRVGTYKSFVEPYLRSDQSEAAEENSRALYGALWSEWKDNVAKARPKANLDLAIDNPVEMARTARGDIAKAALGAGLVDKVATRNSFDKRLVEIAGKAPGEDETAFNSNAYEDYLASIAPDTTGAPIGVITVAGSIVDGQEGPGTAGGDRIAELLEDALVNKDLKGLVVRVSSPGGSVTASERIRLAIQAYRDAGLPVVVSMGDVAASGGYWVSTSSDMILAEPSTITGSIGIFAFLPTFEKTLAEYGVTSDGVKTTPLSGQPDLLGGLNEETEQMLQLTIENGYDRFLTRVARARDFSLDRADQLGQGRVWDGGSARQNGLVDKFGGMDEALAETARLAQAGDAYHPVYLDTPPSPANQILAAMTGGSRRSTSAPDLFGWFAQRNRMATARALADVRALGRMEGAQALCLDCMPLAAPQRIQIRPSDTGWLAAMAAFFRS